MSNDQPTIPDGIESINETNQTQQQSVPAGSTQQINETQQHPMSTENIQQSNESQQSSVQTEKINKLHSIEHKLLRQLIGLKQCLDTTSTRPIIDARLSDLSAMLPEFYDLHFEIQQTDPHAVKDDELQTFEKEYYEVIGRAREFLDNHPRSHPSSNALINDASPPKSHSVAHLTPPKLPTFSGAYEQWPTFHQFFTSLVHSNDSLSTILKYHYLRLSLTGKAAALIQNLDFTEGNYHIALQTLQDEFENKKVMVNIHCTTLLDFRQCPTGNKQAERLTSNILEDMFHKMNLAIQSLSSLGIDTSTWNPMLIPIITSKFDAITLAEWERNTPAKEIPTLDQAFDFLKKQIKILQSLESRRSSWKQRNLSDSSPKASYTEKRKATQSTYGFVQIEKKAKLQSSRPPKQIVCPYCTGAHQLSACAQFKRLSLPDKTTIVKSQSLCFQCLKFHRNKCNNVRCSICSGTHHFLLHNDRRTNLTSQSTVPPPKMTNYPESTRHSQSSSNNPSQNNL